MGLTRRRAGADATPEEAILRLAVLLQAGIAPARAWRHVAEAGDAAATRVCAAHDAGADLPAAVASAGPGWHEVGAAWRIATEVGAPLADGLRTVAAALREARECRDDVRIALAEPAATSRLMAWLPAVAVVLGVALGFDVLGVFLGTPVGAVCLVLGVVLMLVARRWTAALVRRAQPAPGVPGLDAELLALAVSGGAALERGRALLADVGVDVGEDAERILALSRTAGVPAADLLRASAAFARHRARTEGRTRAARLSATLLLPLGACILPAFLLLGVVPMLLGVLTTTSVPL